jgi:hypothetical protein
LDDLTSQIEKLSMNNTSKVNMIRLAPVDVLMSIAFFLHGRDIAALSATCSQLHKVFAKQEVQLPQSTRIIIISIFLISFLLLL